jgi:hypothetical protein
MLDGRAVLGGDQREVIGGAQPMAGVPESRTAGGCVELVVGADAPGRGWHLGGLNLYSEVENGFGDADVAPVEVFAAEAAVVVATVLADWLAVERAANMSAAMERRGVIEQAEGA